MIPWPQTRDGCGRRYSRLKYLFHRLAKQLSDLEGQGQAGIVFLGLDRIHGLPGDAEFVGQIGLSPTKQSAQVANGVLHWYLRFATQAPTPQKKTSTGVTQITSAWGRPAFCRNPQVRKITQVARKPKATPSN